MYQRHDRRVPRLPEQLTLASAANSDRLLAAYDQLRTHGGRGPGVDGLTYADISRCDAAALCRQQAEMIQQGRYRPQPTRSVRIPKSSGGTRELRIGTIMDRVVGKALVMALSPHWERMCLPGSHGCRPGRSRHTLLAELEAVMISEDRWVLTTDDIRGAYDHVVIARVMDDHRRLIKDQGLLDLIDTTLRGHRRRTVGMDQGGPYSPLALNVHLHHVHDVAMSARSPLPRWWRYADNLIYATTRVSEGQDLLMHAAQLLANVGLHLKGVPGQPIDLRDGSSIPLLGYRLRQHHGHLVYELHDHAWTDLEHGLHQAQESHDPPETARATVQGWIAAQGPTHASWRETVSRVLRSATQYGFRELAQRRTIGAWCEDSHQRWCALRERVQRHGWSRGTRRLRQRP